MFCMQESMEVSHGGEPFVIIELLTVFASAWKIMDVRLFVLYAKGQLRLSY